MQAFACQAALQVKAIARYDDKPLVSSDALTSGLRDRLHASAAGQAADPQRRRLALLYRCMPIPPWSAPGLWAGFLSEPRQQTWINALHRRTFYHR